MYVYFLVQVSVEIDSRDGTVQYKNVLVPDCFDVIGDASPSLKLLSLGARVCVRHDQAMFVEGVVCKILEGHPVRFSVAVLGVQQREVTVKRADLRLLRPPWWDELENLDNSIPQIHEDLPQGSDYYHPGSPTMMTRTPASVCTNGQHIDDFCDSDDELRQEAIMFPMENDAKLSGSSKRSSMQSRGEFFKAFMPKI